MEKKMERYYFITEDNTKRGVPICLSAHLYENFVDKETYIKNYVFPPQDIKIEEVWRKNITENEQFQLPEKLFLINKHNKVDVDFYPKSNGFIVSSNFLEAIDSVNHAKYLRSSLEIVTRDGVCNSNINKRYWYIKFVETSPCIDFEKSALIISKKTEQDEQPRIEKYLSRVVFKSENFIPDELFFIDNTYVSRYLYCNGKTADCISKFRIKIMEMEKLFDYSNDFHGKTRLVIE